jgi:leucyl/phenylalanyl-tRNA--protein transferase
MAMPIFLLEEEPLFPPPELSSPEGIIAVGGDLSPQRLLNAYASGIFPWYSEREPILWWSPDPRLVLFPGEVHISKSMKRVINKKQFQLTCDRHFREVIENCRFQPRPTQRGTWITNEIREAYIQLHNMGYAHSVEVWQDKILVGGLYGVSLGKCFFGESMFARAANASKFAFINFSQQLFQAGFIMMDCQVPTDHLKRLGGREVPRTEFLTLLKKGLEYETLRGKWNFFYDL